MLKILVSHNLKVFHVEGERIVQRDLSNITRPEDVLCFYDRNGLQGFCTLGNSDRWLDLETLTITRAVPTVAITSEYHGNGHYSFQYGGRFGRANHLGGLDFVAEHRNLWETFKLLDIETFHAARRVASHRWVLGGSDTIVRLNLRESDFDQVTFGEKKLPMEAFFTSAAATKHLPRFIFFDDWKVHEAFLLNPAVVLVVFGHGVALQQYCECIRSIGSLANYDGTILIVSNIEADHLKGLAPEALRSQIQVIPMQGSDQLDYVGARLTIFNTSLLDEYQPILYSDVDIVFNRPIEPFLVEAVKARRCSAQIEPFHQIATSEHTGSTLVQADPFSCEGLRGFNGGLLLVPNMADHARYIRAAYQTLVRYTSQHGRKSIPFYDQSVLNYTLYKLNDFDGEPVSAHTQIGGYDHPTDPADPRGFIHFWNTAEKHLAMRAYIDEAEKLSQA
ncbi:glycosyltransferase [Gluconobacter oxydans]|uniref:glycosyltransferase n=1 Tax=Gluconobacter oxydans TaxID=442 RepID=UPI001CD84193|nr:glycosyltransferase [Gluconobacter oxydans]